MLWIQSVFVADQFGDEGENVSLNYTYLHGWLIIARDMHTVRNQYWVQLKFRHLIYVP